MLKDITLIIPSHNAEQDLHILLGRIPFWEIIPNEIIIIDSSDNQLTIPDDFKLFTRKYNIQLFIFFEENLYPGHARNIGIMNASNTTLAFLDSSTYPNNKWLSSGLELIKIENTDGVWGSTYYQADSFMSKIFRASTYGEKPIRTFPGSIININIFNRCGLFIETTRAGEDGDWMGRAELQKIKMSFSKEVLKYDKLNSTSITGLIKKWYRNYKHAAKLPFFSAHRSYYYYGVSFVAVLMAFNWNRVLAAWDRNSIFFIPNITTISVILILTIYIIVRGIILPKKKGVKFRFIFPINFIFVFLLSALLDLTKALAFTYSKINK